MHNPWRLLSFACNERDVRPISDAGVLCFRGLQALQRPISQINSTIWHVHRSETHKNPAIRAITIDIRLERMCAITKIVLIDKNTAHMEKDVIAGRRKVAMQPVEKRRSRKWEKVRAETNVSHDRVLSRPRYILACFTRASIRKQDRRSLFTYLRPRTHPPPV